MLIKQKLPLKVKIRRWIKDYKEFSKYDGYIKPILKDIMPGHSYYRILNAYWAIRHRTTNIYHKVDTGLEPGYYDIDMLMLHSCFSLLVRYVEKEYDGIESLKQRIKDLEAGAEQDKDIEGHYDYSRDIKITQEVITLYWWWKNVYPKYEENNPWNKHFDEVYKAGGYKRNSSDRLEPCAFDEDGDPTMYEFKDDRSEELKNTERELLHASCDYETRCNEETDENLMRLIKIRRFLWT